MVDQLSDQRRTLVPKFKLWHPDELMRACSAGTIFVARDPHGHETVFQLKSSRATDRLLKIEKLREADPPKDDPCSQREVSIDQIIHCLGGWPDFLSRK